jgi:transposase
MKKPQIKFDQIVERGCGIDIHKSLASVTIQGTGIKKETRNFDCFTEDLELLREWLKENLVTHIAIESTGVYWKPIYNIMEKDFTIVLVNARHVKNVPGKKTDKKDSRWLAKLLLSGLLNGSFIPPEHIRDLRDLKRYKRKVVEHISSEKNRIHKILEDCNIKLSSVVSDLNGSRATQMIDLLISGESDVKKISNLRHGKMKASEELLMKSLKGNIRTHHKFLLQTIRKSIKDKEKIISEVDIEIDKILKSNQMELDVQSLSTIPGVDRESAAYILSEIGTDMSQFPNENHLASWAGMSPGNNESAGKKKVEEPPMGVNI